MDKKIDKNESPSTINLNLLFDNQDVEECIISLGHKFKPCRDQIILFYNN